MNKIRLALDALEVQSFFTALEGRERGTVLGAESVEVGPAPQTQAAYCWVESGYCLGTRYDDICDTSFCHTRECPIDTADCLTVPPAC